MSRVFAFFIVSITFIAMFSRVRGASEGVLEKIKAGLQSARNYLETAKNIADLVSKSLRHKQAEKKRGDDADDSRQDQTNESFEPTNLMSIFFRLLGLDSKKVTAVAVNSFIFLAQMISELFHLTPKVEEAKNDQDAKSRMDPVRLITESENEKIQNLLKQARNQELPSQLIEHADGIDSSCIRLLLCKTSPIIWAAQDTLKNGSLKRQRDITSWLPTKDQFEEYSDFCDDKYEDCNLCLGPEC